MRNPKSDQKKRSKKEETDKIEQQETILNGIDVAPGQSWQIPRH